MVLVGKTLSIHHNKFRKKPDDVILFEIFLGNFQYQLFFSKKMENCVFDTKANKKERVCSSKRHFSLEKKCFSELFFIRSDHLEQGEGLGAKFFKRPLILLRNCFENAVGLFQRQKQHWLFWSIPKAKTTLLIRSVFRLLPSGWWLNFNKGVFFLTKSLSNSLAIAWNPAGQLSRDRGIPTSDPAIVPLTL